jgi:DNA-binding CsgD family transcriptional regulator
LPLCIEQAGKKLVLRLVAEQPWDQYLLVLEEQTLDGLKSLALLGLSQRETEVLGYLLQGKSNSAIAEQLTIHPGTLRKHLEHVYKKLGVKSRTEAIALVLEKLGLLV